MNCVIPGKSVKAVAKAIQVLSKLGDELYIEGYKDKLTFRTVNSSRSAYACFEFQRGFFSKYELTVDGEDETGEGYSINCKTLSKSCLGIFRSLTQIDKTVVTCKMQVNTDDSQLVFKLLCKHGIVKTHRLNFEDSDSIQAVYDMEDFNSSFSVPARLLSDSMQHFHFNTDEVTFNTTSSDLTIENYVGDLSAVVNRSNMLCTKVTLHQDEFNDFKVAANAKLTFCLKELRAISSFCDFTNQSLRVNYTDAGAPIVFAIRAENYMSDFVLATVNTGTDDVDMADPSASGTTATTNQSQASSVATRKKRPHATGSQDELAMEETLRSYSDTQMHNHSEIEMEQDSFQDHAVASLRNPVDETPMRRPEARDAFSRVRDRDSPNNIGSFGTAPMSAQRASQHSSEPLPSIGSASNYEDSPAVMDVSARNLERLDAMQQDDNRARPDAQDDENSETQSIGDHQKPGVLEAEEEDYDFVEASPPRNKRYKPLFDVDSASVASQQSATW